MRTKDANPQSGLILLLVLWIMIVLTLLATAFYQLTSLEIQTSRNDIDKLQARLLAESALEFGRAVLKEENDGVSDDTTGLWSGSGTLFETTTLGDGMFQIYTADLDAEEGGTRFGMRDEASKLNLNTATQAMLEKIPGMTSEMAAAIVDWRDADNEETPGGAENEYYNNLTPSYSCGNRPFDRVSELLKVKGFTPQLLFGEDINRDGVLQKAEDDGIENEPPDDSDGQIDRGLLPYLTVYSYDKNVNSSGEKRLNIKTATDDQIRQRLQGKLKDQSIDTLIGFRKDREIESLVDILRGEAGAKKKSDEDPTDKDESSDNEEGNEEENGENQEAGEANGDNEGEEKADDEVTNASAPTLLSNEDFKVIADEFSTTDEEVLPGRVNINTAPMEVLLSLPGMTEEVAQTLITRKSSEAGGFTSVAELASVEGMTLERFAEIFPHVSVRSNVFEAQAVGYVPTRKAYAAIHAIIDRGGQGPIYRYYKVNR